MKLLALDAVAEITSVALLNDDKIDYVVDTTKHHAAEALLPLVDSLLAKHKLKLDDLDALVFVAGPGSFTGVRITASVVQGLALACDLPIIRVLTTEVIADAVHEKYGHNDILVAIDARMQQVYFQSIIGNQSSDINVLAPQDILFEKEFKNCVLAGDGFAIYKNKFAKEFINVPYIQDIKYSLANYAVKLAEQKYLKKEFITVEEAVPVYIRENIFQA